jgi:hypothetical protein
MLIVIDGRTKRKRITNHPWDASRNSPLTENDPPTIRSARASASHPGWKYSPYSLKRQTGRKSLTEEQEKFRLVRKPSVRVIDTF